MVRPPNTLKSAFLEELEARRAKEEEEAAAKVCGVGCMLWNEQGVAEVVVLGSRE